LNAGSDHTNATVEMERDNRQIEVNKQYEIDQSLNYIVVAIPKKNNYNTSFTFEYNTDGVAFPWYELFYN